MQEMRERDLRVIKSGDEEIVSTPDEEKFAPGSRTEVDPLEMLLDTKARENLRDKVTISRKGKGLMEFEIRAIDGKLYDDIQDKSTITKRNRAGNEFKSQDNRMLRRLVVLEGVVSPSLKDDRLLQAFGIGKGREEDVIEKALLPGEIDLLGDRILTLSGYTDEMVEVTKK